ncbi:hypothetical protein CAPTEDRAFT_193241 [Capitella teleta]|uniref:Uncharacterized protein n=1 Tax=Capitella teleta TaxID=283909 RepID=R7UI59_CAPTE|nr:hypothetical protein CAPTEDRAFT_193241 [Capitella teleta]|eukprot:ELU05793.1 hypothetical protein CAPTEDRAFT_193241 [Capitella teleta]
MPACAFGYAHALSLSPLHSIALLVVSSCPRGAISNVFTYWTRGDLALSIFMTLVSTILALAFMPLNMFLYLRQWTDEDIKIPFVQNVLVILMTWIPVTIGLVIGGVVNMLFMILLMVLHNTMSPTLFFLSATSWVAGATFPVIGFGVGFLISCVACLQINQCKTVAFETGIQNISVALTLFSLSFDGSTTGLLVQIPLVFAFGQFAFGILVTFLHRIYFRVTDKGREEALDENKKVVPRVAQEETDLKEHKVTPLL